jgi:hypothetical protein
VILAVTLARNGAAVGSLSPGFQTAGVLSINVRGQESDLIRRLAPVVAADPRVAESAADAGNPFFIRSRSVAAGPPGQAAAVATRYTFVSPEYFSLLHIPIVNGRVFDEDEARAEAQVALVSEATARRFWPGQNAVGRSIRIERSQGRAVDDLPGYGEVTVVGTVPDVVSGLIIDGRDAGHIYLPMTADSRRAIALLVKGRSARDLGPEALQEIFRRVATDPQVFEALPLEEMRALQIYPLQAAAWVGILLAGLALVLSVSGLYGVLAYTVNQRTKEIGLRMALGATAAAVIRLVVSQSARLAMAGAAIGLILTFAALKTLGSTVQLQTISFVDAAAFGAGMVLVVAAAALASYHPARRATRIDPTEALRADA